MALRQFAVRRALALETEKEKPLNLTRASYSSNTLLAQPALILFGKSPNLPHCDAGVYYCRLSNLAVILQ
jgi:hypothetical protein